jgi:hypothetical protein
MGTHNHGVASFDVMVPAGLATVADVFLSITIGQKFCCSIKATFQDRLGAMKEYGIAFPPVSSLPGYRCRLPASLE